MSKIRTGIWILLLIFLMLLFFQNQSMFLAQRSLRLNLYFANYQTPELYEGLFFLFSLIIGYLIAYLLGLGDRFRARKIIKQLASANDSQRHEIALLRNEIQQLKKVSTPQVYSDTPAGQALSGRVGYPESSIGGAPSVAPTEETLPAEPEKSEDMEKK